MPKELTQADILRKAAFASLDGRALTPGAKELAAEINTRVIAQVSLDESKPGGGKTNREKLRAATEAFLADLLTAHSGWNRFAMRLGYNDGEVSGWVAWSALAG